jgi:hypothetical protein
MARTTQNNQENLKNQSASKSASSNTSSRTTTSRSASNDANRNHGNQGFASMPKEQVREIAAKGGRHSHDNDNRK